MADNNIIAESIFKSIELIADAKIANLQYDKTLVCQIVDNSNAKNGEYEVTDIDGMTSFKAYSQSTIYNKGDSVYVTVPNGDMLNQKMIVGKYVPADELKMKPYVQPTQDIINITGDIAISNAIYGLLANNPDPNRQEVQIQSAAVNYKGFTRLALEAEFSSWLKTYYPVKGSYGLRVEVIGEISDQYKKDEAFANGSSMRSIILTLDSSEMYGNPYAYANYYSQEKVFNIDYFDKIIGIKTYFYQNCDFIDENGLPIPYMSAEDVLLPDNLFVKNLTIALGYGLEDITEDKVIIGSLDSDYYDKTQSPDERGREIYMRWVHQQNGRFYAIDERAELPMNASIKWYRYNKNKETRDPYAGMFWQRIPTKDFENEGITCVDNGFALSNIVLRQDIEEEKFKCVIECPSFETVNDEFWDNKNIREALKYARELMTPEIMGGLENKHPYEEFEEKLIGRDGCFYTGEELYQYMDDAKNLEQTLSVFALDKTGEDLVITEEDDTPEKKLLRRKQYFLMIFKIIQQIRSKVITYTSNIYSFVNQSSVASAGDKEFVQALTIECDEEGYRGEYRLYGMDKRCVRTSELKARTMKAVFNSEITGETSLTKASWIKWTIPKHHTMIALEDKFIEPEATREETSDDIIITRYGLEYPVDGKAPYINPIQKFKIKEYFSENDARNTVACSIYKNGETFTTHIDMTFGLADVTGAGSAVQVELYTTNVDNELVEKINAITVVGNPADINTRVLAKAKLFDDGGKEITEGLEFSWSWFDPNPEYKKARIQPDFYLTPYVKGDSSIAALDMKAAAGHIIIDKNYNVIKCVCKHEDRESSVLVPISLRHSDYKNYYLDGSDRIVYDGAGTSPYCPRITYKLFENSTNTEPPTAQIYTLSINEDSAGDYTKVNPKQYYPSLQGEDNNTKNVVLKPYDTYMHDLSQQMSLVITDKGNSSGSATTFTGPDYFADETNGRTRTVSASDIESYINQLQSTYNDYANQGEALNKAMENHVAPAEAAYLAAKQELAKKETEVEKAERELSVFEATIAAQNQSFASMQKMADDAKAAYEAGLKIVEQLNVQKTTLEDKREAIPSKDAIYGQVQQASQKVTSAQSAYDTTSEQIVELQATINQLKQSNEIYAKYCAVQNKIVEITNSNNDLAQDISNQQAIVNQCDQDIINLESEKTNLEISRDKISESLALLEETQQEYNSTQMSLNNLQTKVDNNNIQISLYEGEIQSCDEAIAGCERRIAELEEQKLSHPEQANSIDNEIISQRQSIAFNEENKRKFEQKIENLNADNNNSETEINKLQQQLETLSDKIATLSSAQIEYSNITSKINTITNDITNKQFEKEQALSLIAIYTQSVTSNTNRLNSLNQEKSTYEAQLRDASFNIEEYNKQLSTYTSTLNEYQQSMISLLSVLNNATTEYNTILATYQNYDNIYGTNGLYGEYSTQINAIVKEIADQNNANDELEKTKDEKVTQFEKWKTQNKDIVNQLNNINSRNQALQDNRTSAINNVTAQETICANLEKELQNIYATYINPIQSTMKTLETKMSKQKYSLESMIPEQKPPIWTMPILILQNQYESSVLNDWNGDLTIDEKNGTILSTMVGAGQKNADDTFSGVLMGDVRAGADMKSANKIGLYGIQNGVQTYAFKIDGTAFLGASGNGQIKFDGNKGTIESGGFTKYALNGTEKNGMQIDLDGDDGQGSSLLAYGPAGGVEIKTYYADSAKREGNNIFKVFGYTQDGETKKEKNLLLVGTENYYLQTLNYDASEHTGVKMDLALGHINAYDFNITAYNHGSSATNFIGINSGAKEYPLQIGDIANPKFKVAWDGTLYSSNGFFNGGTIKGGSIEIGTGNNVFVVDKEGNMGLGKYSSSNEGTNTLGYKFSVSKNGSVYAQSGSIGGWILGPNNLRSGSSSGNVIELYANGNDAHISMGGSSSGSAKFWVDSSGQIIATTGNFSNINVHNATIGGGTIGSANIASCAISSCTIGSCSATSFSLEGESAVWTDQDVITDIDADWTKIAGGQILYNGTTASCSSSSVPGVLGGGNHSHSITINAATISQAVIANLSITKSQGQAHYVGKATSRGSSTIKR